MSRPLGVHVALLVVATALSVGGAILARGLSVDTQLESLLPENTPTARALDELGERISADSPLTLLVSSSDPDFNRRMQDDLARRLLEWDETRWVTTARDLSALRQGALLYLDTPDLENLADDTEFRADWEFCERVPGCVNLEDRPELPTRDTLVSQVAKTPSGQALEQLLGMPLSEWIERQDQQPKGSVGGRMCTADGKICAVQAVLKGRASKLSYASQMLGRAEALLDEARPADAPADLQMAVSGRYRSVPMMRQQMGEDLRATGFLSGGLLLLVLLLQFRDVRSLLLLLLPLVVGLSTTLGAISLIHPSVNLVSAFTLAVLAGIGIDFGIHLVTYYGKHREGAASAREAVASVLRRLLGSLLAAGVTTGLAFAAVSASSFRGIAEMGWMAGLGIALSLLAYLLIFPSLAIVLERVWPQRGALLRDLAVRTPSPSMRSLRVIVVVGVCLAVGGSILASRVEMERNFRKLRTPKVLAPIPVKDALGGTNGPVVYLLASSAEALSEAANDLVARHYDGLGNEDPVVFYAPSLLLPQNQDEKLPMLKRMREAIDRLLKRTKDEQRERLLSLRRWVERDAALTPDHLPQAMRLALTETDGTFGTVAVLYPPLRGSDGAEMQRLAEQTHAWHARYPDVQFASPQALLGEVLPALEGDAWMMIGLALLGLTVATTAFGRSLRRTALVLLPVVMALCMTGAGMVLLGLKVNLYNTLVFPVAFGMGIDGAVYITWATIEAPNRREFDAHYGTAARAVIGSGLTSLFAFGSLVIAGNPGLASIGHLAVLALGMTLVTNLVWMPALLLVLRRLGDEPANEPPRSEAAAS